MRFLCHMNFLISFRICSTSNLSKYIALLPFTEKVIQRVPIELYSSRFITYVPSFISGKLFRESTSLNLG